MKDAVPHFRNIYEFAASAGALEGFVYHKKSIDPNALPIWVDNLVAAYGLLPEKALDEIQPSLDQTLGRAIRSLVSLLGEDHLIIQKLGSMVSGEMPESPYDFRKWKWFQEK